MTTLVPPNNLPDIEGIATAPVISAVTGPVIPKVAVAFDPPAPLPISGAGGQLSYAG